MVREAENAATKHLKASCSVFENCDFWLETHASSSESSHPSLRSAHVFFGRGCVSDVDMLSQRPLPTELESLPCRTADIQAPSHGPAPTNKKNITSCASACQHPKTTLEQLHTTPVGASQNDTRPQDERRNEMKKCERKHEKQGTHLRRSDPSFGVLVVCVGWWFKGWRKCG